MSVTTISEHRAFGGVQGYYEHVSARCAGKMRFSVFVPNRSAASQNIPTLYYLAGLTCTEDTFTTKGGAQRVAAELGIALVMPDTSPRAVRHPGDDASWDFGLGAGFYVDATVAPWSTGYQMFSYVTEELRTLVESHFSLSGKRGIFGHSMGGHGALVCALREPELYATVSAFAPISSPSRVPWGEKAFSNYLGEDREAWKAYDANELVALGKRQSEILIDQGLSDKFLERELRPEVFEETCTRHGQPLVVRRHEGYDHGYFFISTFSEDHVRHHARGLLA